MGSPICIERPKHKTSLVQRGSNLLALYLRFTSVLQLVTGAGYIAVAVVLQFPPGDPLTLGLWAIGCLAILTAICGCFGGCRVRWCLGVYVVLAVIALAAQLGIVLYLFIAPGKAEDQLAEYQRNRDGQANADLHKIITIGRWVLLALLGAQVLAIGLASCLRCCTRHRSYEQFQEDEQAEYEARRDAANDQLEQLRVKLGLTANESARASTKSQVINLHAVSGVAAEQQGSRQQHLAAMRRSLLHGGQAGEARVEDDIESGKISSRVAASSQPASGPGAALPAQPSLASAWPQATTPPVRRTFKSTWSKPRTDHP